MAEAAISLNGRIYRFTCADGDLARLHQLSDIVRAKLETLVAEYGQVGDDRLLLLSALLIADDMLEATTRRGTLQASQSAPAEPQPGPPARPPATVAT
jgi:cell division protein ZapA